MRMTWWAEQAWLGDAGARPGVLLEARDGVLTTVRPGSPRPPDAEHLRGLTLPGLADAHSHAFHRALRGITQRGSGTFWTWRHQMYAVAERLTPETYLALATAAYAELALAGVTCVGEFHYLHHGPGGAPYDDPNEMASVLAAAADAAGVRLTLLDACYLAGGIGKPLEGPQLRFGDGDVVRWADRAGRLTRTPTMRVGAAIHSVRAVPRHALATVAEWAAEAGVPLHVHLSEQPAENADCVAAYGRTPSALLAGAGALGEATTVVHATHLDDADVRLLRDSGCTVALCPTTERDLADGLPRTGDLTVGGRCAVAVGSDSHAVADLLEEARAVELRERLRTGRRGSFTAAELLRQATAAGHRSLGWPEAGTLVVGAPADLVTVALDSVRTAGAPPDAALEVVAFAATAADVRHVVAAGRTVVRDGRHLLVDEVPRLLATSIGAVREG